MKSRVYTYVEPSVNRWLIAKAKKAKISHSEIVRQLIMEKYDKRKKVEWRPKSDVSNSK